MQVHRSLNPSFSVAVRRRLSFRRSNDEKFTNQAGQRPRSPPHTYHGIDMSSRIDWASMEDPVLDHPATNPPRTLLLIEVPELQSVCMNHGERVFKVERGGEPIRVRDVLFELDAFLHRRAPTLVGSFARPEEMKLQPFTNTHVRHSSSTSTESDDSTAMSTCKPPLALAVQNCGSPVSVDLPRVTITPDRSDSTLESSVSGGGGARSDEAEAACDFDESVLAKWLGERRVFAGMKKAENHDYKLIARMKSGSAR